MNDQLSALKLFARAARVGNFSSAGRELGLSQPSASRLIAALEEEVGATLFSRSTRAVTLTEAGATYLMRVDAILSGARRRRSRGARNGRGARLAPRRHVVKFRAQGNHPAASRLYEAAPGAEDRARGERPLPRPRDRGHRRAFRFGAADSSATARKIIHLPRILMASPDYLRSAARPRCRRISRATR